MKNHKLFYQSDSLYLFKQNQFVKYTGIPEKRNPVILLDPCFEIKSIEIPSSRESDRLMILKNTIRRVTLFDTEVHELDYQVIDKDHDRLNCAVLFAEKSRLQVLNGHKLYTVFNLVNALIFRYDYPDNCRVLVRYDEINYLYHYTGRIFRKREILYHDDIRHLSLEDLFILEVTETVFPDSRMAEKIDPVQIEETLFHLKYPFFSGKRKDPKEQMSLLASILAGLIAGVMMILLFMQYRQIGDMENANQILTGKIKEMKTSRIRDQKLLKRFQKIRKDVSLPDKVLKILYPVLKNNAVIERAVIKDKSFRITGICSNDSRLENGIREIRDFKNITVTFNKNTGAVRFVLEGVIRE